MTDNDIRDRLGRIEGKLDLLLDNFASHEKKDDVRFADISKRQGSSERWQAKIIGMGLAAGTIGGILVEWLHR